MTDGNDGRSEFAKSATPFEGSRAASHTASHTAGESVNALPAGTQLHEYRIVRVIGEGGFSVVYLADDLQLQRTVALKEYIPNSLATRGADHAIFLRSERYRETFELGLRSFVNEARLLASFDHPSLVKVYRFWEQNGTAYMVMPFYEGPTLKAMLNQMPHAPDEAWLKRLLRPLLDALQIIHADHCYHRDIAPDNILLLGADLRPLLLDFGAARRVIGDATQALTVILKPGYAPVEQYAEGPSTKQGAWTDVYALCAVLYTAITGQAPMASVGRLMNDDLVPVSASARASYSASFLAAIDHGLAVRPEDRPQDIAALRAELFAAASVASDDEVTLIRPAAGADPHFVDSGGAVAATGFGPFRPPGTQPRTASPGSGKSRVLMIAGAVAGLVVVVAVVWFATRGTPAEPMKSASGTVPAPAQPTAAPNTTTTPIAAAGSAAAISAPSAQDVAAPPSRGPFSVEAVLEDIVRRADPQMSVTAKADNENLVIGRDQLKFRVKSSQAGYLYVLYSGTGPANLLLLFPNEADRDNRIAANKDLLLPRKGSSGKTWSIDAAGPPGADHIVALVSRVPRDFAGVGLKQGSGVSSFDLETIQGLWASASASGSPYAGAARCDANADCASEFGAALLRISEVAAVK